MDQQSVPIPSVVPPSLPPPPPPPPSASSSNGGGGCQVRCAGCKMILTVAAGLTEFVCPTCQLPQMLPPELMPQQQRSSALAHGIDPTKIQLPCAHCKAILNVPHGLSHFACPQCGIDLAVDISKIRQFLPHPAALRPPPPPLPPMPQEEVNEVAIEVEREEDEGGMAGETFMDYRPPKLSIGPPHPDPIVETSSLSAVQPPEPTYDLKIKDDLESSNALSCLQIETLVYACQRHLQFLPNGTRAGFFVGDGAGVGKGRTIAGLIWENWHHGRRKALWISVGSDLKFDARRDMDDVGAMCVAVHALNKLPYSKLDSKSVGIREGPRSHSHQAKTQNFTSLGVASIFKMVLQTQLGLNKHQSYAHEQNYYSDSSHGGSMQMTRPSGYSTLPYDQSTHNHMMMGHGGQHHGGPFGGHGHGHGGQYGSHGHHGAHMPHHSANFSSSTNMVHSDGGYGSGMQQSTHMSPAMGMGLTNYHGHGYGGSHPSQYSQSQKFNWALKDLEE